MKKLGKTVLFVELGIDEEPWDGFEQAAEARGKTAEKVLEEFITNYVAIYDAAEVLAGGGFEAAALRNQISMLKQIRDLESAQFRG